MAKLIKSTSYAPEIYRSLNGILLAYKPPRFTTSELVAELKNRLTDQLNEYEPRPLSKHLVISGSIDGSKRIVEVPNLADHPLVVGPRYVPWELQLNSVRPGLGFRTSGIVPLCIGTANKYFLDNLNRTQLVNIYHITGKFGYMTDTCFYDGKIQDKCSFKYIKASRLDSALSRIESNQQERLFDSANVPLNSEAAFELAKSWPSRPPMMAKWPVIYRLRCIHMELPTFKVEITVVNETEHFLAQTIHDIGLMMKSAAFTESIRRVKCGIFDVSDSLTDKDWNLQSVINHLSIYNKRHTEVHKFLRESRQAQGIRTVHKLENPKRGDEDHHSENLYSKRQ